MSPTLTYRLAKDDDIPGLIRLWENNSDWGPLTPENCKRWYGETPYGPCITPVAVDDGGEIVGQMKFVPSRVVVDGVLHASLCMHAMILHRSMRTPWVLSGEHPLMNLCKTGIEAATTMGYRIAYSLPVHPWHLLFRRLGIFSWAEYPCLTLPLSAGGAAPRQSSAEVVSSLAADFGEEYADLWDTAARSFPIACGAFREPALLRHKNDGGYFTVEVREKRGGSLIGYCMVKRRKGLIVDLLARTPQDVLPVIDATREFLELASDGRPKPLLKYLRAMQTPFLQPALDSLGFTLHKYKFAFVCASLDPLLPLERIAAQRWFIMPGD